MNEKYTDCVEKVSSIIFNALREREENLPEKIRLIDGELLSLLRAIGLKVMSMLLTWMIVQVTRQGQKAKFFIHRRPQIKYTVIFGQLELESP